MAQKKIIRKKRSDTKIGTIEKQYGVDLGVRSDKKLGNYLKEQGYPSLTKLINSQPRKKSK
jgi:hypothetical protein